MYQIFIAKPIDSFIFPPFGLRSFSEPKIGSERDDKNVSDFHCKTYRFVDFPTVWASGSFPGGKTGSERGARNLLDFHCKTYRFVDFLPFGLPEAFRRGKSNPRGMPGVERERGS